MRQSVKSKPSIFDVSSMTDRRRSPVYDKVHFPAGRMTADFAECFRAPIGSLGRDGRIKSYAETNMLRDSKDGFAPPLDLILCRFLFLFLPSCDPRDRNQILGSYLWEFSIFEKIMQRNPLALCAAVGTPESLIENWGGEDPISNIRKLGAGFCLELGDFSNYIAPLTPFGFTLEGRGFKPVADVEFYIFLDGLRDFSIQ